MTKTEHWNGHEIRFVEKDGEWWAVAKDIVDALGYKKPDSALRKVKPCQKGTHLMSTLGGLQELSIISEKGVYAVIMRSRRKEAIDFQDWVYDIIKTLRQSTGLEGFQIFRMLDKEHQREAMTKLCGGLENPVQRDFIKANTIANKAVSTKYGFTKMVKKNDMTPEMLVDRQKILDEAVELMALKEKFKLEFSVSAAIYGKFCEAAG